MDKTYRISGDGTIFEIKDDGSIAKLAKIDDNGRISTLSGEIMTTGGGSKGRYLFFIIVFAIAAVILGVSYIEADENYSRASKERYEYKEKYEEATTSMRSQISSLEQERDNAKSELSSLKSRVSNTYPLIITDIEIGNIYKDGDIETDYGERIYDYNTMYLEPRIEYIGLESGTKTFKVKWYTPSGYLSRGDSSPSGFSQAHDEYISKGNNTLTLNGWGNDRKGNWHSGTYRIEVWYENVCLKAKTFTIY
ncbi:hypothetical protein [uncultured Parabacteroides sp.]|uniref:hypothetical protein n=1 Tax=uncultured Parabacteroides sp. TaxID=512312 RepID=UPI002601D77D|nr:hypothetical protein [uncultured Parabacteroides sp.]